MPTRRGLGFQRCLSCQVVVSLSIVVILGAQFLGKRAWFVGEVFCVCRSLWGQAKENKGIQVSLEKSIYIPGICSVLL